MKTVRIIPLLLFLVFSFFASAQELTVVVSSTVTSPTNSSAIEATITFSEAVTGFEVADITVANGTATITNDSNPVYTISVEPSSEGLVSISVAASVCVDQSTGAINNSESNLLSVIYDITPPEVVLSDDHSTEYVKLNDEIVITASFTDANGIDEDIPPKISIGTLVSGLSMDKVDNLNWSYTWTVNSSELLEVVNVSISATDNADNPNNTPTGKTSYTIDNEKPEVTVTSNDGSITNSYPFGIEMAFTEEVQGFGLAGISVTNGTAGNLQTTDNTTFTADITPDSELTEQSISIIVIADFCNDLAGNLNLESNLLEVDYYPNTTPTLSTVTIASNNIFNTAYAKIGDKVTIAFTSERALENVVATISGNSATVVNTHANMREWEASYTMQGTDTDEGPITFSISFDDANGVPGSENATTDGSGVSFDRTSPSQPSFTAASTASPTQNKRPLWVWQSTDGVDGSGNFRYKLNNSDFSFGETYTTSTSFQPSTDLVDGIHTLYVQERDEAGNWSLTASKDIVVDNITLMPTLTKPAEGTSSNASLEIDFYLPEDALSESVKMTFVATSSTSVADRIITFTSLHETEGNHNFFLDGTDLVDGTHVLSVETTGSEGAKIVDGETYTVTLEYQDALGNPVASVVNENFFYSSQPPTASFEEIDPNTINSNIGTLNLSFSWAVEYETVGWNDFTLTRNGTPVNLTGAPAIGYTVVSSTYKTAKEYTLNLTTFTEDEGVYVLTLNASGSGIKDRNGNLLIDNASASWTCDKTPPTVTLSTTIPSPTNATSFVVEASISEPTETFNQSIIEVTNANVSSFTQNSPSSYSITIEPTKEGVVTTKVSVGSFYDMASNANEQAAQVSIVFDDTRPIPVITSEETSPTNATTIPISINFGEIVDGFHESEIDIDSGEAPYSIDNFSTTNNRVFNFNLKVDDATNYPIATFTITINDAVCADIASNTNEQAQFVIDFDSGIPELTSVSFESNHVNSEWVRVGKKVTLQFEASKSIQNVQATIYEQSVTASFQGGVWSASYTFNESDITEGVVPFTIDFSDLAGNAGLQVTHLNFGGTNVTFDRTKPVISDVSISTSNPSGIYAKPTDWVYVEFNVDDGNADPSAIIRGQPATLSGSPLWTASRQMLLADVQGFITFSLTATDLAGNVSETVTATNDDTWVIFDKAPPSISAVTVDEGTYKVGDEILVDIVTDDDIYERFLIEVNGETLPPENFFNLNNNSYSVSYVVSENDNQHLNAGSLPVNIVLSDIAGNINAAITSASVNGVNLTIDSKTPQIFDVSSNAEVSGNVIVGDLIEFVVTPQVQEANLQVFPQEYNDKPLVWSTSDDGVTYTSSYEVQNGDTDQISPLPLGEVTLTDQAGNTSNPVLYNDIQKSIYANKPTVTIMGSTSQCYSSILSIPIAFDFTGYTPFQLTYNVGSNTYGPIEVTNLSHAISVDGLSVGEHIVSLSNLEDGSGNFNSNAEQDAVINVLPLPDVDFNVTSSPFNIDEQPIDLSLFVSQPGGVFSGMGVGTDGYFYPQLIDEEDYDTPITITYTYTDTEGNGCTRITTYDVVVSDRGASISAVNPVYCNYHEPFTVTGSNPISAIGEFTVNSPTGWFADGNTLTITPSEMATGDYEILYSYEDGGVTYQATRNFTLDAASENVDFGVLQPSYCKDSPAITLSPINAYPAGGTHHFEGPSSGFSFVPGASTATLIPSDLEAGQTYSITYQYVTALGCSSSTIEHSTLINPLPELNFTLLDNYNYDHDPILLSGSEPNGVFSGTGISNNTLYPNLITPGPNHSSTGTPFTVFYSYTDPATQCSNSVSQQSYVRQANETIEGLTSEYCYSDDVIAISCTPEGFPSLEGTFYSKNDGVTPTGVNQANYSIANAGVGVDTVFFRYTIGETDYEVYSRVLIDSIGPVAITGLEPSYCNNASQVIIVGDNGNHGQGIGNFSYTGTTEAFGNAGDLAYLSPMVETPGSYEITYTYQSSISSCYSEIAIPVDINPVPQVKFDVLQACSDLATEPVEFVNNTISEDEVAEWRWNFNSEGESYDFEPSFLFQSSGDKLISLKATTVNGCIAQKDSSVLVGVIPSANFSWINECLTEQETEFFCTSEETNIADYRWLINDVVVFEGDEMSSFSYLFPSIGQQQVKLVLESFDGCKDSITKQVFIQPLINISEFENSIYSENFEEGNGSWVARSIADDGHFSWEFGSPTGSIISQAASGENSWFTNINLANQTVENSEVVSPCYDFSLLEKPMIKLSIWSSPDPGRDGAVLQYSLNQGETWQNLGAINSGINWFNSSTIQSRPADQFIGWSSIQMEGWESARLSLESVQGEPNVRFRIAYAADGNSINEFNGFAFDDVWIGNRGKQLLLEYFTNTGVTGSGDANQSVVALENQNDSDVIPMHYHTSSPANDPIYSLFPTSSTPREIFYGVSSLPFALINGSTPLSFSNFSANQNAVEISSLYDSPFSIDLDAQYEGSVDLDVRITSLGELTNEDLLLHCAIVKSEVNITESVASGETVFYNVVKQFLPNSGGVSLKGNWDLNEEQTFSVSWNPSSVSELSTTSMVVFIQNVNNKQVYQSESIDLSSLTSSPFDLQLTNVLLYPNPVTQNLIVDSPEVFYSMSIHDITGRAIWSRNYNEKYASIPVAWLKNGVYLLTIEFNNQRITRRFVKQ